MVYSIIWLWTKSSNQKFCQFTLIFPIILPKTYISILKSLKIRNNFPPLIKPKRATLLSLVTLSRPLKFHILALILRWKLKSAMKSFTRGQKMTQFTLISILRPLFSTISSSWSLPMSWQLNKPSVSIFLENDRHPLNPYFNFGKYQMEVSKSTASVCASSPLRWS